MHLCTFPIEMTQMCHTWYSKVRGEGYIEYEAILLYIISSREQIAFMMASSQGPLQTLAGRLIFVPEHPGSGLPN